MSTRYAFTKSLKELRFLFCQTGESSTPLRSFLTTSYPTMKKHNPNIHILMREAFGTEPRVFARYENGREVQERLAGLSQQEIEAKVTALAQVTA